MLIGTTCSKREAGGAMIGAIALLVLASFVIVAMMVSSSASQDASRRQLQSATTEQLARDAGTVLSAAYSSLDSGEFDGFVPRTQILKLHVSKLATGKVIPNSGPTAVVDARVPKDRRVTVQRSLNDGRRGFWQVYSARVPTWGVTKGANVVVYVRAWTDSGSATTATQPMIYRMEFRPTWFADYQMLFDGPFLLMKNATISGKVHSNGHRESFFNQYSSQKNQIEVPATTTCVGAARISTARGAVGGGSNCGTAAFERENTGVRINLLRARDLRDRLCAIHALAKEKRPGTNIVCLNTQGTIDVQLAGNKVRVPALGIELDAHVQGDRPEHRQGAVLVTAGNVNISGVLAATARALIVTATAGGSGYGTGGAPSVWIRKGGNLGSDPYGSARSSFGLVAEGDIIFEEDKACWVHARGAFVTISGLMSIHPTWRIPIVIGGGKPCNQSASITGSIAGHYPPLMSQPANNAGYAKRNYAMLNSLYHNPPPLYPTAADWQVTKFAPANLDCFARPNPSSPYTLQAKPGC